MLRSKPKFTYSGITVVMSNPSRHDKVSLLSANGGHLFNDFCLRPDYNLMQTDVRLVDDPSPLLPNTKVIIILGEAGCHKMLPETRKNSIGEVRGSVYYYNDIPCVPTFFPQDACDFKNLEARLNPLNPDYSPDSDDEFDDDDDDDFDSVKKHGKTKRGNYAFWMRQDCIKAKAILKNGGKVPSYEEPAIYHTAQSDTIINILEKTKDSFLYFDIETDYEEQNLQCFSFSFDGVNVYNIPILDYNYRLASSFVPQILRALAIAIRDNILVAHNGASFDFFVLAFKYRIPVNRCYDTLIAQHRCYPDIEKSLGHCTSLWTWQRFHKDEDSQGYMTPQQMQARLAYCGKDVYTMALIHKAITKHAAQIPGLTDSINIAMEAIRPYLITALQGFKFLPDKVKEAAAENDALMMQYDRIIKYLLGDKCLADIRSRVKGKPKMFAGSNTQCVIYFHELMGYPVIARSSKTQKPALGKKVMYKLALKYPENPIVQLVLAFRTIQKEYGTYKFIPWTDDAGNRGSQPVLYEEEQQGVFHLQTNASPKLAQEANVKLAQAFAASSPFPRI